MNTAKDEIESTLCARLDEVDVAAHQAACFQWPRFDLRTVLKDYLSTDLVFEFTDLQPTRAEAKRLVRAMFGCRHDDLLLFNTSRYFTLLWVSARGDVHARWRDNVHRRNDAWAAWTEDCVPGCEPPQLSGDERWLFKHGQVCNSKGQPVPKPRTFSFV